MRALQPDLAILDVTMPRLGGLEVLREIKRSRPKLPVLVLSMHPENQFAVRVLKAGASGFLNKDSAPEELVKAVRTVIAGGRNVYDSLDAPSPQVTFEDVGGMPVLDSPLNNAFAHFINLGLYFAGPPRQYGIKLLKLF